MNCRVCLDQPLVPSRMVRGERLGTCPGCGLLQLARPLQAEDLSRIYSPDYFKDQKYAMDAAARREQGRRLGLLREQGVPAGAQVLDFGCATGDFLVAAQATFAVWGFDLSPEAAAKARSRLPGVAERIAAGDLAALPRVEGGFAAITAWDVLEHLDRPREVIAALVARLAPGGRIFFSLPNAGAPMARLMGSRWAFMTPPEHVSFFSRPALERLLAGCGLEETAWKTRGKWINLGFLAYKFNRVFPGVLPERWLSGLMASRWGERMIYMPTGDIQYAVARPSPPSARQLLQ